MANVTIVPTSDVTADWDTTTGANHYGEIDETVASYSDADYIETNTLNDVDEFGMGDTPANTDEVTSITLNIRAGITDSSDNAYIQCDLFHSAGTPVTGNPKVVDTTQLGANDGTLASTTETWSGLSLTKTQADSLQLRLTFKNV